MKTEHNQSKAAVSELDQTPCSQQDYAETVRHDLAQQFYDLISTKQVGDIIEVDFSRLPQTWRVRIPFTQKLVTGEEKPPMIDVAEIIKCKLPGLHGYALNAGCENVKMCKICGKTFSENPKVSTERSGVR